MADAKWYDSTKGWATAVVGGFFWALDQWGRAGAAVEIYQKLPRWLLLASPYIAPLFFLVALAFFEARRRSGGEATRKGKKAIKQKEINWHLVSYGLLIAVLCAASAWIITRPNMTAEIKGTMIGESRDAFPAASLVLNVKLRNVGPPTTTSDWSAKVTLRDGETANGTLVEAWITGYAEIPQNGGQPPAVFDAKPNDFLSRKTSQTPIATGGTASGPVAFLFVGYTRDHINEPGNVVTLQFKDANQHVYSEDYTIRAKAWVFVQSVPQAPKEPQ